MDLQQVDAGGSTTRPVSLGWFRMSTDSPWVEVHFVASAAGLDVTPVDPSAPAWLLPWEEVTGVDEIAGDGGVGFSRLAYRAAGRHHEIDVSWSPDIARQVEGHLASFARSVDPSSGASRPRFTIRRRVARSTIALAVVLAIVSALAVVAWSQGRDWRERSVNLQRQVTAGAKRERAAASEISTLKDEKSQLDRRISELTNEKAQVQDERNVAKETARLGAVAADALLECRSDLVDSMSAVLDAASSYSSSLWGYANDQVTQATGTCRAANAAVEEFSTALGN